MEKLDAYFSPKKSVDYEIFKFRTAVQTPDETVDQFATPLRELAQTCDFGDVDREIKSAIIHHCTSKRRRRFAFLETENSLSALLAKARAFEASEQQAAGIEKQSASSIEIKDDEESAHAIVNHRTPRNQNFKHRTRSSASEKQSSNICGHCGGHWPH